MRLEVADVDTIVELVRAGLGVALVAPSSAPRHDGVRLLVVEPSALFTVALITPAVRPLGAAARWFAATPQRAGALVEDFYPLGDSGLAPR